jgi:hypothetical protein
LNSGAILSKSIRSMSTYIKSLLSYGKVFPTLALLLLEQSHVFDKKGSNCDANYAIFQLVLAVPQMWPPPLYKVLMTMHLEKKNNSI